MPRDRNGSWTNWNSHDPGVTTLEAIAYSVADLGYRAARGVRMRDCGWRCALTLVVGAAGAVLLIRRVLSERGKTGEPGWRVQRALRAAEILR